MEPKRDIRLENNIKKYSMKGIKTKPSKIFTLGKKTNLEDEYRDELNLINKGTKYWISEKEPPQAAALASSSSPAEIDLDLDQLDICKNQPFQIFIEGKDRSRNAKILRKLMIMLMNEQTNRIFEEPIRDQTYYSFVQTKNDFFHNIFNIDKIKKLNEVIREEMKKKSSNIIWQKYDSNMSFSARVTCSDDGSLNVHEITTLDREMFDN